MEANALLDIDGSIGEGGGQILRTSIALSAIKAMPVHITKIRYNRSKPGLAAQHITGIRAAGMLCDAEMKGLERGSKEVEFIPGKIVGGDFELDIGTAGSITLVLQACLPVALHADEPTVLKLTGGTDVKFAPPLDYFRYVITPFLQRMGAGIEFPEVKRGYYPKGGGRVVVKITPPDSKLQPIILDEHPEFDSVSGLIHCAGLPGHIPERIQKAAEAEFKKRADDKALELGIETVPKSYSPGVGITLWASSGTTIIGSSALGERGVPAEKLGSSAVKDLLTEIRSGASVDVYGADQLIPYLAIAGGSYTARLPLSEHALTNIEIVEKFYGKIFNRVEKDGLGRIGSESRL
jgi:RNA 3'-phosphate cyclase